MSFPTTNEAKKDQYVGQTKQNVGQTFGSDSLESRGQAQQNTGLIEETTANLGGLLGGTVNTVGGVLQGTLGALGGGNNK
ncbi:uncharacterized protein EV154DRAFT_518219 [Mucor mucedo]|uniref:uncharacterized protein n=1 Tax=Mucor mucedo TaxID=29922 RepID=UPI00221F4BB1|nr:uncharacterized protein EV154DRAFT_518219 [Mucor mucedo]KAI7888296.1 hypothetical protein EV154DRAFT_518219 [Mucor mucedo]